MSHTTDTTLRALSHITDDILAAKDDFYCLGYHEMDGDAKSTGLRVTALENERDKLISQARNEGIPDTTLAYITSLPLDYITMM